MPSSVNLIPRGDRVKSFKFSADSNLSTDRLMLAESRLQNFGGFPEAALFSQNLENLPVA